MTEQTVQLTQGQARPVVAMTYERQQIIEQANAQLAAIEASFQELGRIYARIHQLPVGDGVTYQFHIGPDRAVTLSARLPEPGTQDGAPEENEQTEETKC
jgi:hypothetical protein